MSDAKYTIKNGDSILGILWENEKLGKVLVTDGKVDMNFDLEIYDHSKNAYVKYIDLRDFLLEVLPTENNVLKEV